MWRRHATSSGIYLAATAVCCGLTYYFLQLWLAPDFRIPFTYGGGDEFPIAMLIKGLRDNAWAYYNSRLGAPFGQRLIAYPLPETFHILVLKLLSFTTRNFGKVLNIFYLATYPCAFLCTLFAARRLSLSWFTALFTSFLFTFLPYHFRRGEGHLFLTTYYTVPLVMWVILEVYAGRLLVTRNVTTGGRWRRLITGRNIGIIAICVLTGSGGQGYYAFFACWLAALAGAAAAMRQLSLKPFLNGLVVSGVIGLTVILNVVPAIMHTHYYRHGGIAVRSPSESETYALKITQLLLPRTGHRISAFSRLKEEYNTGPLVNENDTATLGFVGALGYLLLLGWLVARCSGTTKWEGADERRAILDGAAVLCLGATLLGTIGGFGSLFAFLVQSQIRSYNRISVYIAFLALLAVGILLDLTIGRWARTRQRRALYGGGLASLCIIGLLDQTSPVGLVETYRNAKTSFEQDSQFVRNVETVAPTDSMIFQLPYMEFPETGGINRMTTYDLARGYLHSTRLRWSYGTIKGEAGDGWQRAVVAMPIDSMVRAMACAGFSGIYLDRFGYADNGAVIEGDLGKVLGGGPLVANERLLFYSLEQFRARLRRGMSDMDWQSYRDKFNPPFFVYQTGFYQEEVYPGRVWRWSEKESSLGLYNLSSRPKTIVLKMKIVCDQVDTSTVRIASPILEKTIKTNRSGIVLAERLVLPAGLTQLSFSCDAPRVNAQGDSRKLVFGVENLKIVEQGEAAE